jgi:aspartate kinase
MALAMKGLHAVSFTGSQSGIITTVDHANAKIIDVRPRRLKEQLELGNVVIVAGFQGVSLKGEITTLGRGGSDTTAVALAAAFKSKRVIFYKDVPGIFNVDPKAAPYAERYSSLSYAEALDIVNRGARVLHSRCVELAAKNRIILEVRSFIQSDFSGTLVFEEGEYQGEPLFETSGQADLLTCRSEG